MQLDTLLGFYSLSEILIVISRDANWGMMIDDLEQRREKFVSFPRS